MKRPIGPFRRVAGVAGAALGVVVWAAAATPAAQTAEPAAAEPAAPVVAERAAAAPAELAAAAAEAERTAHRALLDRYCVTCHNEGVVSGRDRPRSALVSQLRGVGLTLDTLDLADVGRHAGDWEKVVRKLRGGVMPPAGRPRPEEAELEGFLTWLEDELDREWAVTRDPGRTATFHRLNRTEYRNAIRDLLAVEIEADDFLPADDASFGFDNIGGILRMSQSLMERYLAAARTISRLAVGSPPPAVAADTYEAAQDLPQHGRVERLPFGTRGGLHIEHLFPRDADYDVRVELTGSRNLAENHDLEVTVDGEPVKLVTLGPAPEGEPDNPYAQASIVDFRVPVPAGPREVGVTFFKKPSALVEQVREPFPNPRVAGNTGGLAGRQPFVRSVTITGPYGTTSVAETPSRERIFLCRPLDEADEPACARDIVSSLARRAFRRPVAPDDAELGVLLDFYERGRGDGSFEDGIELALRRLLVSPEFLYRVEADPEGVEPGAPYRVADLDLASRLSFFLWSSIPDDRAARRGRAGAAARPGRAGAAGPAHGRGPALGDAHDQLRRPVAAAPQPGDGRCARGDPFSVAFDESLRQSMLRETELFVDSMVRDDRSMVELLTADYTFLNERLADHYGLPARHRQPLPARRPAGRELSRRGILGHGSILTLTSHAIRTSPVLRGKWILDNLLGTPAAGPAGQRPGAERPADAGEAADGSRAARSAPRQPGVLGVPRDDRPDRFRARELRRHRAAGGRSTSRSIRSTRPACCPTAARSATSPGNARGARRRPRAVRDHRDREADDLRPRPRRRLLRHAVAPPHRARARRRTTTAFQSVILGIRHVRPVPDEEIAVMIVTHKSLSRRTVLRGLGATVALPLLDAMVPALSAAARSVTAPVPRLAFFYIPNGILPRVFHPEGNGGSDFALSPVLGPLAAHRDRMTIMTGLSNSGVVSPNEGGGVHTRAHGGWLNGILPKRTEGADIRAGKTIDQYAADKLGAETALRSLELTTESNYQVGNCENGYSCAYRNSTSWLTPSTPLPHERDPRVVFQRLFGDGGSVEARLAQMKTDRSILDSVTDSIHRLERRVGVEDRATVDEYLQSIRAIERRIQRTEETNTTTPLPQVDQPAGVPDDYEEHVGLLQDMLVLAFQADITRVSCMQMARETSGRTYPNIGVPEAHHTVSHHQQDPHNIASTRRSASTR